MWTSLPIWFPKYKVEPKWSDGYCDKNDSVWFLPAYVCAYILFPIFTYSSTGSWISDNMISNLKSTDWKSNYYTVMKLGILTENSLKIKMAQSRKIMKMTSKKLVCISENSNKDNQKCVTIMSSSWSTFIFRWFPSFKGTLGSYMKMFSPRSSFLMICIWEILKAQEQGVVNWY